MSRHVYGKFKVTDKATGEVHYLTAEQLATMKLHRQPTHHWPPIPDSPNRATTIKLIKDALKKRSGKTWSVTGGTSTAYGWIRIDVPPAKRIYDGEGKPTRKPGDGYMGPAAQAELTLLLGLQRRVHNQGESIPSSRDYYREYIERARGLTPSIYGQPYWD